MVGAGENGVGRSMCVSTFFVWKGIPTSICLPRPRAVVKQDNGYSGNKGGGWLVGRMVLGKHYHPPTTIPETSYPPPSFEMAAAVAARVSQKTSTVYPTRVLTTRTYTRQRFPPPLIAPTKNGKEIRWETLIVESFFLYLFLEWLDSLSLPPPILKLMMFELPDWKFFSPLPFPLVL